MKKKDQKLFACVNIFTLAESLSLVDIFFMAGYFIYLAIYCYQMTIIPFKFMVILSLVLLMTLLQVSAIHGIFNRYLGLIIFNTVFKFSPDSTFGGRHLFRLGWTLHGFQGVIVWQTRCWIEVCFSIGGVDFCTWWHSICRDTFWIQVSDQFDFFAYRDILQGHQCNVSSKCSVNRVSRFEAQE